MMRLLAQPREVTLDEQLASLRMGLILIVLVGVVGIVLILLMLAAWRNFHRRLRELEALRDAARQAGLPADVWQAAGERVGVDPRGERTHGQGPDEDADEDDDGYLYGKEWQPGDDAEEPDDEDEADGDEDEDDERGRPW
ncbi:MAG: hypothetical protein AAGG38_08485 [Planctomycetota bacterium]